MRVYLKGENTLDQSRLTGEVNRVVEVILHFRTFFLEYLLRCSETLAMRKELCVMELTPGLL